MDYFILIDKFLENVIEVDVDFFIDSIGKVVIGSIMEYIEEVGIYFGDFVCFIFYISFFDNVLIIIC